MMHSALAVPVTPHPLVNISGPTTVSILNGRGVLFGWAMVNGCVARIWDGPVANGLCIGVIDTGLGEGTSFWAGERGIYFDNGLTVQIVSGVTLYGTMYYIAQTRIDEFFIDQESRSAPIGSYTQQWPESALLENGYR